MRLNIAVLTAALAATACASHMRPAAAPFWTTLDGRTLPQAEIDATVERLITANDVKGLGLALIADGDIAYVAGYGARMVEKELPLEPDTIIYGASLTKATFAYLVMQLVDEGALDLDRSIEFYLPHPLPEYERYADLAGDPRWRDLTLRLLLSHQSGLANWRWIPTPGEDEPGRLKFFFDPGARYAYSGEGIQIAQLVIEEGLGLDVGAEMQRRIFNRFDMPKTSMTWREDFLENYSHNYSLEGENLRHNIRDEVGAAGSMDTTVGDWAKFLAAVVRGDGLSDIAKAEMVSTRQVRIRSVAQFPSLRTDTTDAYDNIDLGYGLGWGVFTTPFGDAFFKEGHDEGTANYALCVNAEKSCILVMSNSVRAEGIFLALVNTLIGDTNLPWRWEGFTPYDLNKVAD